jgi:hypothetical protein
MRRRKGQSILEYVIVLTVIVAAIAFAATRFIGPAVTTGMENSQRSMEGATNRLP